MPALPPPISCEDLLAQMVSFETVSVEGMTVPPFQLTVTGDRLHGRGTCDTKGSGSAMLVVIAALETKFIPLANRAFPLTGKAAASINVIRGGSPVNIISDYCEIGCDRRLVPDETAAQVLAERDAALAGLAVEHDSQYLARAAVLYGALLRLP